MKWIILFIFLFCVRIEPIEFDYFIVWNVGQGLWQSYITPTKCYHFDMGGEKAPWLLLKQYCKSKINIIRISHWDWDHYGFIKEFLNKSYNTCYTNFPEKVKKIKNKKYLNNIPMCKKSIINQKITQKWTPKLKVYLTSQSPKKDTNTTSEVLIFKDILITGDSPKSMEPFWMNTLNLTTVSKFIVGHHGSYTSTSDALLKKLTLSSKFFIGIVSARKKRYGHPHWKVIKSFERHKAPLLTTEKWGHIIFKY